MKRRLSRDFLPIFFVELITYLIFKETFFCMHGLLLPKTPGKAITSSVISVLKADKGLHVILVSPAQDSQQFDL